MRRGQIWRADFGVPRGSAPGLVRPAVIVSADEYNESTIKTVMVVPTTTNLRRAGIPGNVMLTAEMSGLATDSVANVTQVHTVDRVDLLERLGDLPDWLMAQVDEGLRKSLALI